MVRSLPPRPDIRQLRNQAKDLLRAQRAGDAACCSALRNLRRFQGAAPREILSAELSLHEAQYALALEYGATSWDDLRRFVAVQSGEAYGVSRDSGGVCVTGLEGYVVGADGPLQNSVLGCLAGAMDAAGEDVSYEYLMGVSGAAFRLQVAQPAWCPSAPHAECGFGCTDQALRATGWSRQTVRTQHDGQVDRAAVAEALALLRASLERGVPGIWSSEEAGLIVGLTGGDELRVRPYSPRQQGYVTEGGWPWFVEILQPGQVADRRPVLAEAFRTALTLAHTPAFGGYASGLAAYALWAEQLEEEARFADLTGDSWFRPALANGYVYGSLWSARTAAEVFLRDIADEFPPSMGQALVAAAEGYRAVHESLGRPHEGFGCAWSLMPWHLGSLERWTPAVRRAQAEALREAADLERRALGHLERALAALAAPTA